MAGKEAEMTQYLTDNHIEELFRDITMKLILARPPDALEFIRKHIEAMQKQKQGDDHEYHAPAQRKASRRGGVSASVMDENESLNYEKKVIPKDATTMKSLLDCVKHNVLFSSLDEHEMNEVLDAMFLVKHAAGDIIMKQGDDGDNFYCIGHGTVEIWVNNAKLNEITDNGSFGELALIYGTPRAATIKSKTDSALWAIDRDTYRRILMGSTIRKRKLYEAFLEKVALLKDLDKWERLSVADALEPCQFVDGEVIIRQGEPGDAFYIIVAGNANCSITNAAGVTSIVKQYKETEYFGEIALLNHSPRAATVTATGGPVKCVKLDRERFERVLGPCDAILRRNLDTYKSFSGSS